MKLENVCILWKHRNVMHVKKGYDVMPDCMACDGKGVDAEKHNWPCYKPMPIVKYEEDEDKARKLYNEAHSCGTPKPNYTLQDARDEVKEK